MVLPKFYFKKDTVYGFKSLKFHNDNKNTKKINSNF